MTSKPENDLEMVTNFLYKAPICKKYVFPNDTVVSSILDKLLDSDDY